MGAYHHEELVAALHVRLGDGPAELFLGQLAGIVATLAERWQVDMREPMGGGGRSVVIAGRRAQQDVILKVSPVPDELTGEIAALQAWSTTSSIAQSSIAPAVLEVAPAEGAYLMERILPGERVRLHGPPTAHDLDRIASIFETIAQSSAHNTVPAAIDVLQERSRGLAPDLAQGWPPECPPPVEVLQSRVQHALQRLPAGTALLHGDCWKGNILVGDQRWMAIDPYGWQGRIEIDIALFSVSAGWGDNYESWRDGLARRLPIDVGVCDDAARIWAVDRCAVACRYGYSAATRVPTLLALSDRLS